MNSTENANSFNVTSLEQLAKLYDKPIDNAIKKQTDRVIELGRDFIAASPFLIMATANEVGIDCSPKGETPGFVQLLDDRTLLIPDRPGNNRVDGMKNIIANPKVGIIFMVPGSNVTYRVNGSARISIDPDLLCRFEVRGKLPHAVIIVSVEEAFSHCPKAFVRAKLWNADGRPDTVFTIGQFAAHMAGGDNADAAIFDEKYVERMKDQLY